MILPQLGRNPQQFDNVYNASVRAHDRGLGAVLADTASSIASDMAANAAERRRKEEEQQKIYDAEFKRKQANAFVQNYGEAAMSGKTDFSTFYNDLAALNPEVADRTLRLQNTLALQNRPKSGPSDLDRLATQSRFDLALKADPVKWNNLTPEEQDAVNQRITYAQQRLSSNGSIYGEQTTQQQNDAPVVPRVFDEQKARDAVTAAIAKDDPKTETVEGIAEARDAIARIVKESGIPNNDRSLQMVLSWLDNIVKEREQTARELKDSEMRNLDKQAKVQNLTQGEIDNAYKRIDSKYPGLRTEQLPMADSVIEFVIAGDKGDISARNNLVKKISRMGSNEALSETDFGRAIGRQFGDNFLSRLQKAVSGQDAAITDAEWTRLKSFAKTNYDKIVSDAKAADPSGKFLKPLRPWPTTQQNQGAQGGKQETALERARRLKAERGGK